MKKLLMLGLRAALLSIDVAFAALYFPSDESKYVTGLELNVDSGMRLSH